MNELEQQQQQLQNEDTMDAEAARTRKYALLEATLETVMPRF